MNNNYDQGQQYQPQYDQQAAQTQYQDPNQYQYQDPNQQYVEQQPEEKKSLAPERLYLILSIVGVALDTVLAFPLAGIIVSIVAMLKGKKYFAEGGECVGEAKIAKILSIVGIALGAVALIGQLIVLSVFGIGIIASIFGGM